MPRRADDDMPWQLHDAGWLRGAYIDAGRSSKHIAVELGVANTTVLRYLAAHSIPRRRGPSFVVVPGRLTAQVTPVHEILAEVCASDRRYRAASSKTLARRVREVARHASTSNRHQLRHALVELAACAICWAERLPGDPPR